MGQCLRGKLIESGLIPAPATTLAQPETAPAAAPAVSTTEPDTALVEPALDVTPPAAPSDLVSATFGLLRAEPDGSVVIAGSGTPGTEVEVYSNGDLLGTATVESSGDWVLVPDAPIPPGGTEITLGEAGKEGRAEQAFVVAINEDKTSEPLVVASTPGAASQVLQGIKPPEPETQVASATPAPAAPAAASPAEPAVPAPATPAAQPEAPSAPAPVEPTPVQPAVATPAPADQAAVTPPAPSAPAAVAPAAAPSPAEAASQPEPVAPDAAPANPSPSAGSATAIANAEPATASPGAADVIQNGVPPTIDAIEIEGDRTFFAGGGPEGATMRLYVDDAYIADAKVADGRWLIEAGKVLTKPSQRVRVDMLQPGTAEVASRAEVDFVVEPAIAEPATTVATAEAPAAPEPAPAAPGPAVPATVPAVPAAEPAPVASADVSAPATPAATSAATVPASAEPATAQPAPARPAPVPAQPEPAAIAADVVPTMVAVSVGDPNAQRFASGKAIIRRGDNLWTIARRVYGQGIKYTTIYDANTGQIRDPDRIYPGQVFALPTEN